MQRKNGQISLEFLMVMLAFLASLLLFLPLLNNLYNAALFRIDVENASAFLQSLEHQIDTFAIMGDGSSSQFSIAPLNRWVVSANGNTLVLTVKSNALQSEKQLSLRFPNNISLQTKEVESKTTIRLVKYNGMILVEYA